MKTMLCIRLASLIFSNGRENFFFDVRIRQHKSTNAYILMLISIGYNLCNVSKEIE